MRVRAVIAVAMAVVPALADAEEQPGKVLAIESRVLPIEAKVLEIVGLRLGLDARLKELGAKVTETEIVINLSADVLFDFDKASLKPEAIEALSKVAGVLTQMPEAVITIEGHTDSKGSEKYNLALSERRAKSVRDWLAREGGLAEGQLTTQGFGEARPVAPNTLADGSDDPEGRLKNRRVEIRVRRQ